MEPPVVAGGSTPLKLSDKALEKNEKSISWLDDGKSSNLIALAETTLEVRPYHSNWGDIQQKWSEVARLLGDRKAIPPGKNYRAVQGKMKDLLEQLQRHQEDSKKPSLSGMSRCPFSEKLLRLLTLIQEQSNAPSLPRPSRKRDSESRRASAGDEDSERSKEKRRRAAEERLEQLFQEKDAELRRLKEETMRYEAMRRELEARAKVDEERRRAEREVEGATLDAIRLVLAGVEKLKGK